MLHRLDRVAPAFIDMAHAIVWASAATVDSDGKPRTRILHPIWEWDGTDLFGWVATAPTRLKREHLTVHPYMAVSYWTTTQDTCAADCLVEWYTDDETCTDVWQKFATAPEPVGYDPAVVAPWKAGPTAESFAVLRLAPYRLRVMPGRVMTGGSGEVLRWHA